MYQMIAKNSSIFTILIIFFSFNYAQDNCPEIYVPPYGDKPRECPTSIGSTCLITCPDDFDIIGSCFRTCIMNTDNNQQIDQIDHNADLKMSKKTIIPLMFSLKPKKQLGFLPTTSINKMINSNKKSSCCNKQQPYSGTKNDFFQIINSKNEKLNYRHSENCPGHNLPEHHLLQSISKMMQKQEENFEGRQSATPQWSGYQPYCVNLDVQCRELDPPANGFFYYCSNYAGLFCAIGCRSGYRLIGSRALLCTIQGTWSSEVPTCQQI